MNTRSKNEKEEEKKMQQERQEKRQHLPHSNERGRKCTVNTEKQKYRRVKRQMRRDVYAVHVI